jgi:hypothetical protein
MMTFKNSLLELRDSQHAKGETKDEKRILALNVNLIMSVNAESEQREV